MAARNFAGAANAAPFLSAQSIGKAKAAGKK
jgi:hypothetical protein